MNKKIISEFALGIILLIAVVIGGIFYWQNKTNQQIKMPAQRACTMEAKLCDDGSYVGRTEPNCEFAPCPINSKQQSVNSNQEMPQMANPASVYCEQNGGKLEIRTAPDGGQTGYCKFNNGSECEEWAYFRKECGQNKSVQTSTTIAVNNKVAILVTIKNSSGKLLKGIRCALKSNDENDARMMPDTSMTSNSSGECHFSDLDSTRPYLLRIYWTEDKSRVTDLSLSFITPGTTAIRTVIKPDGY
jgi:putative hemolysin